MRTCPSTWSSLCNDDGNVEPHMVARRYENMSVKFPRGEYKIRYQLIGLRECVSTGAAGAQTRRSLGHHLLHPLILRLLALCASADLETQSSPGCTCTGRLGVIDLCYFALFEEFSL